MKNNTWHFINKSVRGASHERNNAPCQDYSLCVSGENGKLPVVLTVSDGHGGSRYVRSAQGAVFACETAVDVVDSYACVFANSDANIVKQLTETRLKIDIVKGWRTRVLAHARKNPFSDAELSLLELNAEDAEAALDSREPLDGERIFAAYGATLLVALILENVFVTLQIGDGDIFFYNSRGSRVLLPVPKDERLLGNETTSLCSLKAPFHMRHNVAFAYGRGGVPDLIMLASDGYANSFSSETDYHKACKDYYDLLKTEGPEYVAENVEGWLDETSRGGSGDDITLAIAWREKL